MVFNYTFMLKSYDKQYQKDSHDARIWILEKEILIIIIHRYKLKNLVNHLDFASGTGRIFEVFKNCENNSIGIDVSESMLVEAKKKYRDVTFIKKDLTSHPNYFTIQFDLITTFRFFLNAENSLRENVLSLFYKIL